MTIGKLMRQTSLVAALIMYLRKMKKHLMNQAALFLFSFRSIRNS